MSQHNMMVCTYNHCYWGTAASIIHCECVCSPSYPASKAHTLYYTAICGLSSSTTFFHIIS